MAGSEILSREEVDFLEALAKSMCRPLKRRAHVQAAPVLAVPAEPPQDLQAEELLSLPASSNLAIAECGPRAAGKLLASVLRQGQVPFKNHVVPGPFGPRAACGTCIALCDLHHQSLVQRGCLFCISYGEQQQVHASESVGFCWFSCRAAAAGRSPRFLAAASDLFIG